MNFSTNQVLQFYALNANSKVEQKVIKTPDGAKNKAVVLDIDGDRTDIIPLDKVLGITTAIASDASQQLTRKGVLIKLRADVNEGNPIAGQDYIIRLKYRGHIGEEDCYHKFAEAHATLSSTPKSVIVDLAKSFLAGVGVEYSPLYELYTPAGTAVTTVEQAEALTEDGFYIVEPVPYWSLGKFPETLMKIELGTPSVYLDGDEVEKWLENYKFEPVDFVSPIYNSHKIADLEYFAKGEKGLSAGLVGWPDNIEPNFKVNPAEAKGYDMLTIHYAFVGANTSNQRSERDLVIVAPSDGTATINKNLSTIKTNLEALL